MHNKLNRYLLLMKSHFIIKMKTPLGIANIPYWVDFISNRNNSIESFSNEIDEICRRNNFRFWITAEYKPTQQQWSAVEIETGLNRLYRIVAQQDGALPNNLLTAITTLPIVAYVREGSISSTDIPNTLSVSPIDLKNRPAELIYLKPAHLFSEGNPEIKIAVLDTGVNANHPEIKHAVLEGMDFVNIIDGAEKFIGDYLGADNDAEDEVGHGTHVAGIIAGKGIKIAKGVAPKCKIIPVRVLGAMKQGDTRVGAGLVDNINAGIKWAVDNGAHIINMSLGIKHEGGGLPHEEVINYALKKGVTVIAASGNDGTNDKYYPGALPEVIAVGAIDEMGRTATFSTYGWHVSIVAPGTNIMSAYTNNKYAISSGTSQAAPFVAGVVALLKSYALDFAGVLLKDHQIKYLLKRTADKIDKDIKNERQGFGKLNALDAIKLLKYKLEAN
jgi:thermitase